jgi:hypothetical protein
MAAGERSSERANHDDRRQWRLPDLRAHTTGGGETGGDGKVEQRGSQICAWFAQRWPAQVDPPRRWLRGV